MITRIFLLLALTGIIYEPANGQNKLVKLSIRYENFLTETPEDLHCEYFDAAFANTIKYIDITDSTTLLMLNKYIRNFRLVKPQPLDVRAVITIWKGWHKKEYCMNIFGVFFDEKTDKYYTNKQLSDFIIKRCL